MRDHNDWKLRAMDAEKNEKSEALEELLLVP